MAACLIVFLAAEPHRAAARRHRQHRAVTPARRAARRAGGAVRDRRREGGDGGLACFDLPRAWSSSLCPLPLRERASQEHQRSRSGEGYPSPILLRGDLRCPLPQGEGAMPAATRGGRIAVSEPTPAARSRASLKPATKRASVFEVTPRGSMTSISENTPCVSPRARAPRRARAASKRARHARRSMPRCRRNASRRDR